MPGVRVNVSKKGVSSVSVGRRGATVNIGKKGVRNTVGIPGSGLSYSSYAPYSNRPKGQRMMGTHDEYDDYEYDDEYERPVSFLLGLGIFLLPLIFAWFTLRRGHTTKARLISFGWLILLTSLSFIPKNDGATTPKPTPQTVSSVQNSNTQTATRNSNDGVNSESQPMQFNDCVGLQKQTLLSVAGTGYKTSVVVDSADLSVVRVCTNDGSVLITCNRLDGNMITTQSPHCP